MGREGLSLNQVYLGEANNIYYVEGDEFKRALDLGETMFFEFCYKYSKELQSLLEKYDDVKFYRLKDEIYILVPCLKAKQFDYAARKPELDARKIARSACTSKTLDDFEHHILTLDIGKKEYKLHQYCYHDQCFDDVPELESLVSYVEQ
jgi:hypothetical protein